MTPRRERKRRQKTNRILDKAMELVVEGGVEALTVHRLADELDYSPGALYRYFPSMSAILAALQARVLVIYTRYFSALHEILDEELERQGVPAPTGGLAQIAATGELYRGFARHLPAHFQLVMVSLGDPRQLLDDDSAMPMVEPLLELLRNEAAVFQRATSTGALEDGASMERALALWAGLHGALALRKLGRFAPQMLKFDRLSMDMSRTMLRGWGANREELDRAFAFVARVIRERSLFERVDERVHAEDADEAA